MAAVSYAGLLSGWFTGLQVAVAVGLWLVLGGSIAVGWALRRLDGFEGDRGVRISATALAVTAIALVGLALLSYRGPVGIFNLDGYSTTSKVFALVELAFGGSWAWLGWRTFERPLASAQPEGSTVGRRTWIVALAGSVVVGVIIVGAGVYWVTASRSPASPPVDARFEGTGGERAASDRLPGGRRAVRMGHP